MAGDYQVRYHISVPVNVYSEKLLSAEQRKTKTPTNLRSRCLWPPKQLPEAEFPGTRHQKPGQVYAGSKRFDEAKPRGSQDPVADCAVGSPDLLFSG